MRLNRRSMINIPPTTNFFFHVQCILPGVTSANEHIFTARRSSILTSKYRKYTSTLPALLFKLIVRLFKVYSYFDTPCMFMHPVVLLRLQKTKRAM